MPQRVENRSIGNAVELLQGISFEEMAEAVTSLMNTAMVFECSDYLSAAPYKRWAGDGDRNRRQTRVTNVLHY